MSHDDAEAALPAPDGAAVILRHLVATLAYRAAKTLRDAPPGFAAFASGPTRGRVGPDQPAPRSEFDGDASARS